MSWEKFIKNRKFARNGLYYLNSDVERAAKTFNKGLYIYTDEYRWERNRYKNGLTERGEIRIVEQINASADVDFYVVGFIPLGFQGDYDKVIHKVLSNEFGCRIIVKESSGLNTEWVEFPEDVDPVGTILLAIQYEREDDNAGRVELFLTLSQMKALQEALEQLKNGNAILAELCPRFGKTVWAAALFDHLDAEVMIVGSYVLSSLNSFKTDIVRFTQFEGMKIVNNLDELLEARAEGKRSIIPVSLHDKFAAWQKKNQWIVDNCPSKFVFIDEADFGAHTKNQVEKVKTFLS